MNSNGRIAACVPIESSDVKYGATPMRRDNPFRLAIMSSWYVLLEHPTGSDIPKRIEWRGSAESADRHVLRRLVLSHSGIL